MIGEVFGDPLNNVHTIFRRMKRQAPEEKWNRIQKQIQESIRKGYPNPERKGCPGQAGIAALATRSAKFDDSIEDDPQWQHVTHCSPCYNEYLDEFRKQRLSKLSGNIE
jgi:hypothetical protein